MDNFRNKEIAILRSEGAGELLKDLSPAERIFIYYIFRAILVGNSIAADQLHRDSIEIINIFELIYSNANELRKYQSFKFDIEQFLNQAEVFLIYLWSSHGLYFARENSNEKRTPSVLGLDLLNPSNLIFILETLNFKDAKSVIESLEKSIFDSSYEPTATVPDSIDKSAVNIYSDYFTDKDFESLPYEEKSKLNAYFYIDKTNGKQIPAMMPYSLEGKYSHQLEISIFWLKKAYDHANSNPKFFDKHLIQSIKYLIEFFKTGDEEFFKRHSIEWLKSSSKVDYTIGFIETYKDPKGYRGLFEAEVTIKTFNLDTLNKILPSIEASLPFPKEFIRDGVLEGKASMPNASINKIVIGTGEFGPMGVVAAYCLPNYEEIRSTYGSKQIIYEAQKGLGEILNPVLNIKLNNLKKQAEWILDNDSENKLKKDLWNIQCILHETIGHASGKLWLHTFREDEKLTFEGKNYKAGDTLLVTNKNLSEFLAGYEQTIEELRAEIIALYVSINFIDELKQSGILGNWLEQMSKEDLIRWLILNMVDAGLYRLTQQNENAVQVAGDHARANQTIMNFLCDDRGISIKKESIVLEGQEFHVLGCHIDDLNKVKDGIKELMVLVQKIKSTGDGVLARELITTYGCNINFEHLKIMLRNKKFLVGELKATSYIYPNLIPEIKDNHIRDIKVEWPKSFSEQQMLYSKLAFSKDI